MGRGGRRRGHLSVGASAPLCVCTFVLATCTGLRPSRALQPGCGQGRLRAWGVCPWNLSWSSCPEQSRGQAAGASVREGLGRLLGRGDLGTWQGGRYQSRLGSRDWWRSALWPALGLCF